MKNLFDFNVNLNTSGVSASIKAGWFSNNSDSTDSTDSSEVEKLNKALEKVTEDNLKLQNEIARLKKELHDKSVEITLLRASAKNNPVEPRMTTMDMLVLEDLKVENAELKKENVVLRKQVGQENGVNTTPLDTTTVEIERLNTLVFSQQSTIESLTDTIAILTSALSGKAINVPVEITPDVSDMIIVEDEVTITKTGWIPAEDEKADVDIEFNDVVTAPKSDKKLVANYRRNAKNAKLESMNDVPTIPLEDIDDPDDIILLD